MSSSDPDYKSEWVQRTICLVTNLKVFMQYQERVNNLQAILENSDSILHILKEFLDNVPEEDAITKIKKLLRAHTFDLLLIYVPEIEEAIDNQQWTKVWEMVNKQSGIWEMLRKEKEKLDSFK